MDKKNPLKNQKKLISIVLILIVSALTRWLIPASPKSELTEQTLSTNIQYSPSFSYTKHARCRMECRHIDADEIKDVLNHGQLNARKSDPHAQPCPVIAKEKVTKDSQRVRVVFAQCPGNTKIITVIDLENEFKCHCD